MFAVNSAVLAAEARIRPYILETPLIPSPYLSEWTGASIYLKLENRQHTGSFKLRGAINKILSLSETERSRGVVTASTGNHGLAVAHAAAKLGIDATIYLPELASPQKVEKLRKFNVILCFVAGDAVNAEITARRVSETECRPFISPYNDPLVVAGQGTVGVELLRQQPDLDAVLVAVGGGGLIGGIAGYLKAVNPAISIAGCLPENSPVMLASVKAGQIVDVETRPTLSDGTAGGIEAGAITFALSQRYVDGWRLVSEGEIAAAVRLIYREHGEIIEGAAGVAVAALIKQAGDWQHRRVAVVLCGGNIETNTFHRLIS